MRLTIALLLAVILLGAGCTDKTNNTGYIDPVLNQEDVIISGTLIDTIWNYRDTVQTYSGSTVTTVGNSRNIRLLTLLRWEDFPSDAQALSATMSIVPSATHTPDNIDIQFARLDENWDEGEVTWTYTDSDVLWENTGHEYESIGSIAYDPEADTISVDFPLDVLQYWLDNVTAMEDDDDLETNNFGIVLFSDTPDQFLEILTLDSDYGPILEFDYLSDGDTMTYSSETTDDITIYHNPDEDVTLGQGFDGMVISNIYPYRTVVKIDFDYDVFNQGLIDAGLDEIDEYDYRLTTVSMAELVFDIDADQSYMVDDNFSVQAYMMLNDNPSIPLEYSEDYVYYSGNSISYYDEDTGQIRVEVTSLIQSIMSGEAVNYGFLIRSIEEDRDLGRVISTTEPHLEISFARPFIEEF